MNVTKRNDYRKWTERDIRALLFGIGCCERIMFCSFLVRLVICVVYACSADEEDFLLQFSVAFSFVCLIVCASKSMICDAICVYDAI